MIKTISNFAGIKFLQFHKQSLWNKPKPDVPCDINKVHLIYVKSLGKLQWISLYVQRISGNILWSWGWKETWFSWLKQFQISKQLNFANFIIW